MTDRQAIANDLLALRDLLDDYVQQVDSWDLETLIDVRNAALVLIDKAQELDSAMKTEMIRRLELAPKKTAERGGMRFRRKPKHKTEWDHSAVIGLVADIASRPDPETGEARTSLEVARTAAMMLKSLLTSPSTPVKLGELVKLGADPDEYRSVSRVGWELEVTPIGKTKENDDD